MSVQNLYKVIFQHKASTGGKPNTAPISAFVVASAGDENTLRAVLATTNGVSAPNATIDFVHISVAHPNVYV
jgi:hypothetical protein